MEERNRIILETVEDMLDRGGTAHAVKAVTDLHAADIAEILSGLNRERELEVLRGLEPGVAATALFEMEEGHQVKLAECLGPGELGSLLERMPVDEAVDLLGDIPDSRRLALLSLFSPEDENRLRSLLAYGDDTAGGLMTTEYLSVLPRTTADEVIGKMREVPPEIETIYYVYVLDESRILMGVLSLRELIVSPPDARVEEMIRGEPVTVSPTDDQEQVADIISRYNLLAVPVVDRYGAMMGIVTVDDAMDVIDEEAEEDLIRFAGGPGYEEEPGTLGLLSDMSRRIPWFVVTVAAEILIAGGLLKLYSPVLERVLVLVFFIPLLVTMGGNIAVQSATVVGRWLTTGRPPERMTLRKVAVELTWGILVGVVTGGTVTGLSLLFIDWGSSVGLVVGISLALTVIAASMVGCALPLAVKFLKRDPAAVSGPLLGVIMDVVSLAIYLLIGRALI